MFFFHTEPEGGSDALPPLSLSRRGADRSDATRTLRAYCPRKGLKGTCGGGGVISKQPSRIGSLSTSCCRCCCPHIILCPTATALHLTRSSVRSTPPPPSLLPHSVCSRHVGLVEQHPEGGDGRGGDHQAGLHAHQAPGGERGGGSRDENPTYVIHPLSSLLPFPFPRILHS